MEYIKYDNFVGVDVSKDTLDIYFSSSDKSMSIKNNTSSISAFLRRYKSELRKAYFCIDLTGGYDDLMVITVASKGYPVHRASGRKLHAYRHSYKKVAKTDKEDSKWLSKYASERYRDLFLYVLPTEIEQELRELSQQKRELIKDIVQLKTRMKSPRTTKNQKKYHERLLRFFEKEQVRLDNDVSIKISADKTLSDLRNILVSFAGISDETAHILLINLPELGRLGRRELASLVGLSPMDKSSGKKVAPKRIGHGRDYIKSSLYLPTLSAIRFNERIHNYYHHLLGQGKLKKVATVACMRKMICILNARCRDYYHQLDKEA